GPREKPLHYSSPGVVCKIPSLLAAPTWEVRAPARTKASRRHQRCRLTCASSWCSTGPREKPLHYGGPGVVGKIPSLLAAPTWEVRAPARTRASRRHLLLPAGSADTH